MNRKNKGYLYEKRACEYLESQGVRILEKNFNGSLGEVDIIGYHGDTLVFFEVKYRGSFLFGSPSEGIDREKIGRIYVTAQEFIRKNRLENERTRFDAVLFQDEEVHWLKGILWGDELGVQMFKVRK